LAPVVGVSWFEAEAYGNWLSQQDGRPVRLPTEQEWERAARGVAGREYAWGNGFDRNRLNCAEFWAGKDALDWNKWFDEKGYEPASTTIVGQFPSGATPEGIGDLSGNVWEWTASWYEKEQVNRVLRGGSWNNGCGVARCADRNRYTPDDFDVLVGFRLVSPGILLDSGC
jgi:formylglycine-generating enzyme required for sulfatase activity